MRQNIYSVINRTNANVVLNHRRKKPCTECSIGTRLIDHLQPTIHHRRQRFRACHSQPARHVQDDAATRSITPQIARRSHEACTANACKQAASMQIGSVCQAVMSTAHLPEATNACARSDGRSLLALQSARRPRTKLHCAWIAQSARIRPDSAMKSRLL